MQLIDGRPVYAATDLVGFLACSHRLALERAALRRPRREADPQRSASRARRQARPRARAAVPRGARTHQGAHGRRDRAGRVRGRAARHGRGQTPRGRGGAARGARQTIDAMRGGADVVYQATFFDGRWRGHADFLLRKDERPSRQPPRRLTTTRSRTRSSHATSRPAPSSRSARTSSSWHADPGRRAGAPVRRPRRRSARHGPAARRRLHGLLPPGQGRVRGDRRAAGRRHGGIAYPPVTAPTPSPWSTATSAAGTPDCRAQRRADDDLSLVAGASSRQRTRAQGPWRGDPTRARRPVAADAAPARWRGRPRRSRVSTSRRASRSRARTPGEVLWELLAGRAHGTTASPSPGRGLLGLPEPSPNDLFFDIEGDPFALDDGVDYLFGVLEPGCPRPIPRARRSGPTPAFHAIWSLDEAGQVTRAAEKAAFERLDRPHHRALEARSRRSTSTTTRRTSGPPSGGSPSATARGSSRSTGCSAAACSSTSSGWSGRASARASRATRSSGSSRSTASSARSSCKDAGSSIVAFETWLELGPDAPVDDAAEHPARDRGLQPRRRPQQLAPARLARGAAARPGRCRTGQVLRAPGPRRRRAIGRARREGPARPRPHGAAGRGRRPGSARPFGPTPTRAGGGSSRSCSPGIAARTSPPGGATSSCSSMTRRGARRRT